jgi:hypothetical protein
MFSMQFCSELALIPVMNMMTGGFISIKMGSRGVGYLLQVTCSSKRKQRFFIPGI